MKRRSFLTALFGAPMLPAAGAVLTNLGDAVKADAIEAAQPVDAGAFSLHSGESDPFMAGSIRTANGSMHLDLGRGVITLKC